MGARRWIPFSLSIVEVWFSTAYSVVHKITIWSVFTATFFVFPARASDGPALILPQNFFTAACNEVLVEWSQAKLPEGKRTIEPGDFELIEWMRDHVVIHADRYPQPDPPVSLAIKKISQARTILAIQADRLKTFGLTPIERELFDFYRQSNKNIWWKIYQSGSYAGVNGVSFGHLLPTLSFQIMTNPRELTELRETAERLTQLSRYINTYQALIHELFHFRSWPKTGHGIAQMIVNDHSPIGRNIFLFEELLANRAATGSVEKSVRATRIAYLKSFEFLEARGLLPNNFAEWTAESQFTFFEKESRLELAFLYQAFSMLDQAPGKAIILSRLESAYGIQIDQLLRLWKPAVGVLAPRQSREEMLNYLSHLARYFQTNGQEW